MLTKVPKCPVTVLDNLLFHCLSVMSRQGSAAESSPPVYSCEAGHKHKPSSAVSKPSKHVGLGKNLTFLRTFNPVRYYVLVVKICLPFSVM